MEPWRKKAIEELGIPANYVRPDGKKPSMREIAANTQELYAKILSMDPETVNNTGKPIDLTKKIMKQIKDLPKSDQIWYVEDRVEVSGSGTFSLLHCDIGLVIKEYGSNGKPWRPNGANNTGGAAEECDGLSLNIAKKHKQFDNVHQILYQSEKVELILSTIASGCLNPCDHFNIPGLSSMLCGGSFKPCRPLKILFGNDAIKNTCARKLSKMGIRNVDVAEANLVSSMRASFYTTINTPVDVKDYIGNITTNVKSCYVSEERKSLGRWQPPKEFTDGFPIDYWARAPSRKEENHGFQMTRLFGWRTNLELACERGDTDKINELCDKYPLDLVRDFAERRLLLSKASSKGLLTVCQALLSVVGCGVEGVKSHDNKREWVEAQRCTGNNNDSFGMTPLCYAAQGGNASIVEYFIRKGANVNVIHGSLCTTPLHLAVINGSLTVVKLLLNAGADRNARDMTGCDVLILATSCYDGVVHGNKGSESHRQIIAFLTNPNSDGTNCVSCNKTLTNSKKCPCGMEVYCNKECQLARWKAHKKAHKEIMKGRS